LITFTEKVRLAYKKMLEEGYDKEYAKAVVSYLGLAVNRVVEF
jgi:putative DNA methylase